MNKNPTVSVIIPTYNRAHLVGRAIQSVLNQTYKDFELIIIDDGSTDNTENIIKEFQKKDKRTKYIKHNKNKGGSAARNTGIKAAKGEYIAFQDSDCEWLPEKLGKQIKIFKRASPEIGVVYTGSKVIKNNKKFYAPSSKIKKKEGNIYKALLEGNFISTGTAVVVTEYLKKVGMFDERLPRFQDWELWIRLSKYYRFKFINEPLYINYRQTAGNISNDQNALIVAQKLILEKHLGEFKEQGKKFLSKKYFSLGNLLCQNGEMSRGREYILKAIRIYSFSIKYFCALFFSMFNSKIYNRLLRIRRIIFF